MSRRSRKAVRSNKVAIRLITIVLVLFLAILGINILHLKKVNKEYALQEKEYQKQKDQEIARQKDIADFEEYTKTLDYVEEIARKDLGMVKPGEIVFKVDPSSKK